jgi:tetratricopeptide (TPR) repeat protein
MRQEGTARSAPQPKVISFPPRKTRSIEPAPFPPASVPHRDERTLVGRDFESKQLLKKLDDLADSRGFVQHILGDAGIGKTRLAEGTARVAAELGIAIAWGSCPENRDTPPFWPWQQLLSMMDRESRHPPPPEIASLLGRTGGSRRQQEELGDEEVRLDFYRSVESYLRSEALVRPWLIIIDDLHWADLPSLSLLQMVMQNQTAVPLGYLALHCSGHPVPDSDRAMRLDALLRQGERMHLLPLDPAETAKLVAEIAGQRANSRLAREIHGRTGGNPFFIEALVRELRSKGDLGKTLPSAMGVPEGIRSLIRRRLQRLSPQTKDCLSMAAALGQVFHRRPLAEAWGKPDLEVLEHLEEAQGSGLLEATDDSHAQFRFEHGLVRETILADLLATQKAAIHGAVAEALLRESPVPSNSQIAGHFVHAAADPRYLAQAIAYSIDAGDDALRCAAPESARSHLKTAAELAAHNREGPALRAQIELRIGHSFVAEGRPALGFEHFERAQHLARVASDPRLASEAALGLSSSSETGMHPNLERIELLEKALAELPLDADDLRAQLQARLSEALYFSERSSEALPLAEAAAETARSLGNGTALAHALGALRWVCWSRTNHAERDALADEMVRRGREAGSRLCILRGLAGRVYQSCEGGSGAAREAAIRTFEGEMERSAQTARFAWSLELFKALHEASAGRFEVAEHHIFEAARLGENIDPQSAQDWLAIQLVQLRELQGRTAEILPAAREIALRQPYPVVQVGFARILLQAGLQEEAAAIARSTLSDGVDAIPVNLNWPFLMQGLSEVVARTGLSQHAPDLYRALLPFEGRNVVIGTHLAILGPTSTPLALLAEAKGDLDAAERHFETALRGSEYAGLTVANARIRAERLRFWQKHRAGEPRRPMEYARLEEQARVLDLGHLLTALEAPQEASTTNDAGAETARLVHTKAGWTLHRTPNHFSLRRLRGYDYLAKLIASPDREIGALELMGVGRRLDAAPLEGLDRRAVAEVKRRLRELALEEEHARETGNAAAAASARQESEALAQQLSRDLGLGGRQRRRGTPAERARVNVTRSVLLAIRHIRDLDPELGRDLSASVRTGTFCEYRSSSSSFHWSVEPDRE